MSKGYDPKDLEHCKSRGCASSATAIVLRRFKNGEDILIGYCAFHAIAANVFFSHNPERSEVKGIRPC